MCVSFCVIVWFITKLKKNLHSYFHLQTYTHINAMNEWPLKDYFRFKCAILQSTTLSYSSSVIGTFVGKL